MQKKSLIKCNHFIIKSQEKLYIQGMYLHIIKPINHKPITNTVLNGEILNAFLLKSGTRQGCSLFPLLFNIVLKFLAL
jgi:hypothetical protein